MTTTTNQPGASIIVTVNGPTAASVQEAILALAAAFGAESIAAVAIDNASGGTEAKVKATRGKKAAAPAPATEDADILAAASEAAAADTAVDTRNVVMDMTPAAAREAGIKEIQDYFTANPDQMPAITKLTTKYGVSRFLEVTDDRALEFYADVKLVVAGAGDAL